MLAALITAQLLDFALLLSVPPPTPRIYPIAEVAQQLRGETRDEATYRVTETASPPGDEDDPRSMRQRAQLAQRLGVGQADVRLDFDRPPLFLNPIRRPHWKDDMREPVLFGHFSAALRLPDGGWRVVRPAYHGIEPWHWRMLLWLLGLLVAVAPFAWWVARRVAQPIGLFAAAADRLGRDPRADPMAVEGPAEVAIAAEAFNGMQARIRRYVDDRVTMAAAMAHDLRTPLMRLSLRVEKAEPELRRPMEADIHEMREMIGTALAFVRDIDRPPRRQKLSLRALVESVGDEMVDLGADVTVEPGADVVIEADVAGLKALLANLIGNAVAYAGQARVRIANPDGHALIEVADDGPGLPGDMLERVFEPFFRAEPSRNRETGGSGLGLASARAVARAHGGEIKLINRAEGGLLARVLLPL
ncbi:HAMP domain-containing histidine kinase [Sphingomonas sp. CGMCC 1.13654]|uniref:histidine kinase n=2 Tax=Sphingomonas chungangi TaxID=2683589 RepID=A0A838L7N9_9SPHN|nr:HAMP domain-containing histidine kinase [Sphingomonas chungangi]MVW58026.1 HAMP domain-containing protein [Sphingomonas chungangi]